MTEHLVFDGGFASELTANGFEIDGDPLWSARLLSTNPQAILKVHKSYLSSGADAVLSSTYQASISGFQKYMNCSPSESHDLVLLGARLVKQACKEYWYSYCSKAKEEDKERTHIQPLACASLGPYGAFLSDGSEYKGDYLDRISQLELMHWHDHQLSVIAKEELNFYVFETIPGLAEAEAIISLIRRYPNHKFVLSFSCKDGSHISHGERIEDVVKVINQSDQVVAFGINCTAPDYISPLLRRVRKMTEKKLLVMPNSGEIWEEKQWRNDRLSRDLSSYVSEWVAVGANWIGGCCRTTPNDISNIKDCIHNIVK